MNTITGEDQLKNNVDGLKGSESTSQFYGGMKYKQNENKSLYHFGNTTEATVADGSEQEGQWPKLRLIRDKCINLYKKYTYKGQRTDPGD